MATRGTALSQTLQFFREADLDVARVTFQLVEEVMQKRMEEYEQTAKSQRKAASTPRKARRKRGEATTTPINSGAAAQVATGSAATEA